jgi:hypothetical protein
MTDKQKIIHFFLSQSQGTIGYKMMKKAFPHINIDDYIVEHTEADKNEVVNIVYEEGKTYKTIWVVQEDNETTRKMKDDLVKLLRQRNRFSSKSPTYQECDQEIRKIRMSLWGL